MAGICLLELLAATILISTVLSCPDNCNGRGTCDRSVSPNLCRCQPMFIGEGCEFETFEETRIDPFTPLVSGENIRYLPFAVKACGNVYFELRRSDSGGYGFELGGPGNPFSTLDRVPIRETGQLDTNRGVMIDCQNFREFWLDWDTGMVRLGTGSVRGQNVILNSPSEQIPGISQIILNSGSWKLPLQYKAPFETTAQLSEFNGLDMQGTGMMQQGSPMVIGGVNPPASGQFVQGQTMFAPNQMVGHTNIGTTHSRKSPIEEVNLSSGRSLEIECGIKSADPNLEIKWTKNGVPWTPPQNNPKIYFANNKRKIVFESVTEEDNGNYMCVANNLFKTSSTTDLFLETPESAMIVHEPTRLSPTLGKRLEILCDIHSTDPNLKISWMKNGQPFNPVDERIGFYFDNKIIVFNAVEETDNGKYTCRGSDGYVNPTSIIVNVLKPESQKFSDIFGPNAASQQAGQLLNTGALQSLPIGSGYFEILCNANPADVTSAIRWTKNGKPFNFNPNNPYVYFTRDRRKIIFESLTPDDNGIYTCYLNDTDVSSASTDLFIENANDAMVSFMPETKHPMVGGILELRCDVTSSDPNVRLSWTKNETPLLPGKRVIMQNKNTLVTVYNVTAQDSGQYKCIANGDLSTAVSTFVNVHSKEPGTVVGEMDNNKFAALFGNSGGGQFFLDGNRMSGNQMVRGSVLGGGQMVHGQMVGGQMIGGSMAGGGQMVGGGMIEGQMVGGQMISGSMVGGGQMVGGQTIGGGVMVGNQSSWMGHVAGMRTISQGPMEEKVISSGYFEIHCNIPGEINGDITWLKDGHVYLIPSNRPVYFKNNKKTIIFLSVAPEDNGLYTCIVNNQYQASASTDLFIENKEYYNKDWARSLFRLS